MPHLNPDDDEEFPEDDLLGPDDGPELDQDGELVTEPPDTSDHMSAKQVDRMIGISN